MTEATRITDEQALAITRLANGRPHSGNFTVHRAPYALPTGYIEVTFAVDGYTAGIAPNGDVST